MELYLLTGGLFIVVVLLIRHLNCERVERREMMERYRELAFHAYHSSINHATHPQWTGFTQTVPPDADFSSMYADVDASIDEVEGVSR